MKAYNAGMKGQKGSPDQRGVRVPFFVRWDGHYKPRRDIDVVSGDAREVPVVCGVSNSLAFGGNDAALVMKRVGQ